MEGYSIRFLAQWGILGVNEAIVNTLCSFTADTGGSLSFTSAETQASYILLHNFMVVSQVFPTGPDFISPTKPE